MEPLVYISCAFVVVVLLVLVSFLRKYSPTGNAAPENEGRAAPRRAVAVNVESGPGGRRRGARQRLHAAMVPEDSDEEEADVFDVIAQPEGKVGAKKLRKLEAKAEKKAQRESELEDREERKKREKLRGDQRKREDTRAANIEAAKEEEERVRKAEEERREHEEYLKLKEMFSVEEEGTHEEEMSADTSSILTEFIDYIKQMKVVMLEDLAARFKLRTQDAIDRVQTLMEDETLTGVMDDRGKFIYITQDEYNAVAKFIRQRGRVSLRALAESSNQLINLNPDLKPDSKKMEGEHTEETSKQTEQTEQWPRKRLIGGNQNVE